MRKLIYDKNITILIPILILAIFSILNMMNAGNILVSYGSYYYKQILWFIIGFCIVFASLKFNVGEIFRFSYFLYGINVILLVLVLFFGKEINGTRAWFDLSYFSFQPSELMKLSLLLSLANLANSLRFRTIKNELKFIFKVIVLTIIPSILTFLEPDTGAVLIYFIIATFILFASRIRVRWFVFSLIMMVIIGFSFFYFYQNYQDEFIKIFGTSFFYRMDRIMLFKEGSGMQIENALIAIGSAGLLGTGINTVPIYFPEAPTDFVFALSISNFGFLGGLVMLSCYFAIFLFIIKLIKKTSKKEIKIFMIGFLGMFLFQTTQSILMNIGLIPIIGITLPFLSYGGSSTLLYFTGMAIILGLSGRKEKYPYWIF